MADDSIDVGRLSIKAQVALGAAIALVVWVLTASAAFAGFQLAMADLRNKQDRADERFTDYRNSNDKAVEEVKRQGKLNEMNHNELKDRVVMLEAAEKARNIVR